jgi:hypothetical protein
VTAEQCSEALTDLVLAFLQALIQGGIAFSAASLFDGA